MRGSQRGLTGVSYARRGRWISTRSRLASSLLAGLAAIAATGALASPASASSTPATPEASAEACTGAADLYITYGCHSLELALADWQLGENWQFGTARPTIDEAPEAKTNASEASFAFSGHMGGTFECAVHGRHANEAQLVDVGPLHAENAADARLIDYEPCSSPVAYHDLGDGDWLFYVREITPEGNASSSSSYEWSIRTATPPAPTVGVHGAGYANQTGYKSSDSAVILRSTGKYAGTYRDDQDHVGGECRLDGGPIERCDHLPDHPVGGARHEYSDLSEGFHVVESRTITTHGNRSEWGSYEWKVDLTPPPAPGISGPNDPDPSTSAWFRFEGEGVDPPDPNYEEIRYDVRVDGGEWERFNQHPEWEGELGMRYQTFDLPEGRHTLEAREIDRAGNVGPIASYSWTIDKSALHAPEFERDGLGYPKRRSGERYSHFMLNDAEVAWMWESPAPEFECSLDGAAFEPCGESLGDPETYAGPLYEGLAEGRHTFRVRGVADGRSGPAAELAWKVDLTPPQAPDLVLAPPDPAGSHQNEFEFARHRDEQAGQVAGEDAYDRVQCKLDDGAWTSCPTALAWYDLVPEGRHTMRYRARDVAGNLSAIDSYAWTVDNAAWAANGAPDHGEP